MIVQDTPTIRQHSRVGRRGLLKASGALAGSSAALARAISTRAQEPLTFDVACDGGTMLINRQNQTEEIGLPRRGDTFIVTGTIFPAGSIEAGLAGPNDPGAIGRWTCRGTFNVDIESGGVPHVSTSVVFSFGEELTATTGQVELATHALLTDGFEGGVAEIRRVVVGGYGRYAGARGEVVQLEQGGNDTLLQLAPEVAVPAPNLTFVLALAD